MLRYGERKRFKGKVSITRSSGVGADGGHVDTITVELGDVDSGSSVVEIEMDAETFGLAVTGRSSLDCEFVWFQPPLGCVRELKNEEVLVAEGDYRTAAERAKAALTPYEVDGWAGRVSDAMNQHNVIARPRSRRGAATDGRPEGTIYKVLFERFVPKEDRREG